MPTADATPNPTFWAAAALDTSEDHAERPTPLRVLLLEDSAQDARIIERELHKLGAVEARRVEARGDFERVLEEFGPDVVLLDFRLPTYDGGSALEHVRATHPEIPAIIVTGSLGEEEAADLLKAGAKDYVLKEHLSRLAPAVARALLLERERRKRLHAEAALRESETRLRRLVEHVSDIIAITRFDGTVKYISPALYTLGGYRPEELTGGSYLQMLFPDQLPALQAYLAALAAHPGEPLKQELRFRHRNGSAFQIECVARNLADTPGIEGIVVTMRDVTWRRQAEERLKLANELIEQSPTVLFRWGVAEGWPVLYASQNVSRWGYAADALMTGRRYAELIHPDDVARVAREMHGVQAAGTGQLALEYRLVTTDGHAIWVDGRTTVQRDAAGAPAFFQGVVLDITERKRREQDLQLSRSLIDLSTDSIELYEPDTMRILDVNQTACRELGYERAELLTRRLFDIDPLVTPDQVAGLDAQLAERGTLLFESVHRRKDGSTFPVEANVSRVTLDRTYQIAAVRNITERKRVEAQKQAVLDRARRHLEAMSRIASADAVVTGDVEALARLATEQAAAAVSVERASVWLFNEDETELRCLDLYEATSARHSSGAVLREAEFACEFQALKSARYVDAHDAQTDPRTRGYLDTYLKPLCITSMLDTVVQGAGRHLSLLCLEQVGPPRQWLQDEIVFAGQVADKIGICMANHHRSQVELRLRRGLEQMVHSLTSTVEMRDPYTAGHQRRVAAIAVAIARELGVEEERVRGLELAASVHDIGKIQVPAEILAKPGRLGPAEMELVRGHAEAGYLLLKDIDLPWPVATMIRQHHERLDGSGYPQGLKSAQILEESRILAVADVVEATASHRPYRAARGLEAALDGISNGRGSAFDAAAVDACLRLFRERGFHIPE